MNLNDWLCAYFAGAVVTAASTDKLDRFYRVVLLWPLYWCYLLLVLIEMAVKDIRHG
jgi:hypothetical protein